MRKTVLWNDNWRFTKEGVSENVTLPHTWNAKDGTDGQKLWLVPSKMKNYDVVSVRCTRSMPLRLAQAV